MKSAKEAGDGQLAYRNPKEGGKGWMANAKQ